MLKARDLLKNDRLIEISLAILNTVWCNTSGLGG